MGVELTTRRYLELIGDFGRQLAHTRFPNDIEVYLFALELTTAENKTIDYMLFPINPSSISKLEPKRTNIKATSSGITVLTSAANIPQELVIKGNFGRNFKIMLRPREAKDTTAVAYSTSSGVYDLFQVNTQSSRDSKAEFDVGIKTGYAATRILKAIIAKSNGRDEKNRPFRLYFYNLAFGESYLVTVPPAGIVFSQNEEKNMIWEYTLNLTVIAPIEAVRGGDEEEQGAYRRLFTISAVQNLARTVSRDTRANLLNIR